MNVITLLVWDPAVLGQPKSFADIMDTAGEQGESEAKPTDLLMQFAQAVQEHARLHPEEFERYQNYVDRMKEEVTAIVSLEVPYRGAYQDVIVFLVETASQLGLVVLYEDSLMAWLPGGQILPKTQAKEWDALKRALRTVDPEKPRTLKQFKKLVEPTLLPVLSNRGYILDESKNNLDGKLFYYYSRNSSGISEKQEIGISYIERRGEFLVSFSLAIYSKLVIDVLQRFEFNLIHDQIAYADEQFVMPISEYWYIGLSLTQKIIEQRKVLVEGILSSLDKACTIEGLDFLMNSSDSLMSKYTQGSYFIPHCAVVAWLARNPHFDDLVLRLEAAKNRAGANKQAMYGGEFQKLVNYLREEVKPLV